MIENAIGFYLLAFSKDQRLKPKDSLLPIVSSIKLSSFIQKLYLYKNI